MIDLRPLRGGSWLGNSRICRSATHLHLGPGYSNGLCGFRVISTSLYTARTLHLRTLHPLRGGSWRTIPLRYGYDSSTIRDWNGPDDIALDYGFRVTSTTPMTERPTPESP